MLTLKGVAKYYGGRAILEGLHLQLKFGQRVALVGPNGEGKTTLLKVILGELEADKGSVHRPDHWHFGYLSQHTKIDLKISIYDNLMNAFIEVQEIEKEMRTIEQELKESSSQEQKLLQRYDELQNRYALYDPPTIDARVRSVAQGLGFEESQLSDLAQTLSGGWRMRVALAQLLLRRCDVLLLDEPTNHLDMQAIEWLSNFLAKFDKTLLFVSHNRNFIDRCSNQIWHLQGGEIEIYHGNYEHFLDVSIQRFEAQAAAFHQQQKELAKQQKFIERFRYKSTLATRVQSRIKQLAKLHKIEAPELRDNHFSIRFTPRTGERKVMAELRKISHAYDEKVVLNGLQQKIEKQQKIALLGANGCGKTTLLRAITGQLKPQEGICEIYDGTFCEFYTQHQTEKLNPKLTVYEQLQETAPISYTETELRTLLGCLLFTGDAVHQKIEHLSGGEKARVNLALTVVSPCNLLLMDEPTNHLDISAIESLTEALRKFPASLVLVSHDTYFVEQVCNTFWELEGGQIIVHPSLQSYRNKVSQSFREPSKKVKTPSPHRIAQPSSSPPPPPKPSTTQWTTAALEKKIHTLEQVIKKMDQDFIDNWDDISEEQTFKYNRFKEHLKELNELWEIAFLNEEGSTPS